MQHAVVRIFDAFERAQRAREALLAEGFEAGDILFHVANDEAGPVHGNFMAGNTPLESKRRADERKDACPALGAHCLMTVATPDPALAARADAILARHGARTMDELAWRLGGRT